MLFSDMQLSEFRKLLSLKLGRTVTSDEAAEQAGYLMNILLLISRELPTEKAARLKREQPEAPLLS